MVGHTIDAVNAAKYLGVTIDSKLIFNNHVDVICKRDNGT